MSWFRLKWLSSQERELLKRAKEEKPEVVGIANGEVVSAIQNVSASQTATGIFNPSDRPYKNIFYSNKNLTVVFWEGTMLSKSAIEDDIFQLVRKATTEKQIEDLLIEKVQVIDPPKQAIETVEERKLVANNLGILRDNSDFVVSGDQVCLKGVNLPMPAMVISSFIEICEKLEAEWANEDTDEFYDKLTDQYQALKMFWLKLALNTLPQSREDLLVFVKKNDVRITKNGNLILYRRIVSKEGTDTKLVTFVTQEYYKVKKAGFDPRLYAIGKDIHGEYFLYSLDVDMPSSVTDRLIGNLQVMYLELPTYNNNNFTSAHDDKVSIKLGGTYSIPEKKINLNNGLCAAGGLHAAAVDYDYSGFGDIPVVVLVNPSKAITVPRDETGKLRTTEMFIACVNDKASGVHFDEEALSSFDSEYHDFTLQELEQAAESKSFEKLSVLDNVPAISLVDLNQIKEMLRSRIKGVV